MQTRGRPGGCGHPTKDCRQGPPGGRRRARVAAAPPLVLPPLRIDALALFFFFAAHGTDARPSRPLEGERPGYRRAKHLPSSTLALTSIRPILRDATCISKPPRASAQGLPPAPGAWQRCSLIASQHGQHHGRQNSGRPWAWEGGKMLARVPTGPSVDAATALVESIPSSAVRDPSVPVGAGAHWQRRHDVKCRPRLVFASLPAGLPKQADTTAPSAQPASQHPRASRVLLLTPCWQGRRHSPVHEVARWLLQAAPLLHTRALQSGPP